MINYFISRLLYTALLCTALNANAGVTMKQLNEGLKGTKEERSLIQAYVSGVENSYFTANLILRSQKRELLYCQPESIFLSNDNRMQIIYDSANKSKEIMSDVEGLSVSLVLLVGLIDNFPCK